MNSCDALVMAQAVCWVLSYKRKWNVNPVLRGFSIIGGMTHKQTPTIQSANGANRCIQGLQQGSSPVAAHENRWGHVRYGSVRKSRFLGAPRHTLVQLSDLTEVRTFHHL